MHLPLHDRRVVVPEGDGQQQRAGLLREQGRARGHPGPLPEEVDLDAGGGQIAVGDQADQAAVAQSAGQRAEGGAAAVRQDLHAEALAVGDEAVVERLGLQAFGDRRERRPQRGGDPGAGQVPVGQVRQGEDHAPAGGEPVGQVVEVLRLEARPHPLGAPGRQPEGLHPVAQVRAHARAGQLGEPLGGWRRAPRARSSPPAAVRPCRAASRRGRRWSGRGGPRRARGAS